MKRLKYLLGKYHIDGLTPEEGSELREIITGKVPGSAGWNMKDLYDLGLIIVGADSLLI